MTRRAISGTTLLELLIVITLLSLLVTGVMMSMRVGLSAMTRSNDRLVANRVVASAQRIVEAEIAGLIPVIAPCQAGEGDGGPHYTFFEGRSDEMRLVSDYSLQEASRGYPRVLEFRVIPGERNEGVRLIVNELFYTSPRALGPLCMGMVSDPESGDAAPRMRPVEAGPASFVLADRLAYCRFAYREKMPQPIIERWVPEWRRSLLPTAVRIDMAPLRTDPSRVQPLPLTVAVRVTKEARDIYKDESEKLPQ